MAKPLYNLVAKSTDTGEYYTLGTVWPSDNPDFPPNVQFKMETDKESQFKTISLFDFAEATKKRYEKDGKRAFFLDLKPIGRNTTAETSSSDEDTPF